LGIRRPAVRPGAPPQGARPVARARAAGPNVEEWRRSFADCCAMTIACGAHVGALPDGISRAADPRCRLRADLGACPREAAVLRRIPLGTGRQTRSRLRRRPGYEQPRLRRTRGPRRCPRRGCGVARGQARFRACSTWNVAALPPSPGRVDAEALVPRGTFLPRAAPQAVPRHPAHVGRGFAAFDRVNARRSEAAQTGGKRRDSRARPWNCQCAGGKAYGSCTRSGNIP
jgi:hypothetical protein